ncbi:MAG: cysteine--tRNA ligase [bacterium]|nr:cysteine--tRNA ligase [bacterium]
MSEIFLTNTLGRKKEKFEATNSLVTIYSCGPTVYRNVHIGNLRTYISVDLLIRALKYNGYEVRHVKNITDVGHMRSTGADTAYDPIINEALKEGKTPAEIAEIYTQAYFEDQKKLNILDAHVNPKATEHIAEMIALTEELVKNDLAYEVEGTVYFDVKKFKDYGKLSGNTLDKMGQLLEAVRVSVETDKKDSVDFALWKLSKDDRAMVWDSPWGKGFPGWHIECSAMSLKHLTKAFESGKFDPEEVKTIDIHSGGEDLIFPHHEDEIAQSQGASGKEFVKYWFHGGFLTVDDKKMSRSAGNYLVLNDIESKEYKPLSFRYLTLTAHYRSKLNFTWESLTAAQIALKNLYREISRYYQESEAKIGCAEYEERFLAAVNDDLDTPKALTVVWELVKSDYPASAKLKSLLKFDEFLGLDLHTVSSGKISDEVGALVEEREKARAAKDFAKADELRAEIAKKGFEVVDEEAGPKLKKIIQ